MTMWSSRNNATNEEPTRPRSRFFGFGKGKNHKEEQEPASDWALEMRNDAAEGRGDNEHDEQRKKRRWLLLQKALSADKNDDGEEDVEADEKPTESEQIETARSTSSNSFSTLRQNPKQTKVVFRQFGSDPSEVMKVEQSEEMPVPESSDHVLVKIQVRSAQSHIVSSFLF